MCLCTPFFNLTNNFFFQLFVTWMYVWSIVAPWQFCGPPSTPRIPLTGESKWFRDFFMLDAERPKQMLVIENCLLLYFHQQWSSLDLLGFWLNRIFHQISYKLNILYAKFNMLTVFLTYENNMAPVSTVPSIWSSKLNSGNLHKWHTTIPTISPINLYLLVIHKVLRLKGK